jgi:hypothetical protein
VSVLAASTCGRGQGAGWAGGLGSKTAGGRGRLGLTADVPAYSACVKVQQHAISGPGCHKACAALQPASPLPAALPTWQLSASNSLALSLKAMISVGQTKVKSCGAEQQVSGQWVDDADTHHGTPAGPPSQPCHQRAQQGPALRCGGAVTALWLSFCSFALIRVASRRTEVRCVVVHADVLLCCYVADLLRTLG